MVKIMKYIDIRSDTVTQPTDAMRQAMFDAVVGDDVYDEDTTVKELERKAAELTGKEAALFVPSGTFGNQLALFTHCNRGDEVILGEDCHIVVHEVGASSVIAGVQLRTVSSRKGVIDPYEVKSRIRSGKEDIHYPSTGLVCLENAHSNGRVIPLEIMKEIYETAREKSIPVHLDGARLFNASEYLKVSPCEVTKYTDSVMFCLSKGLCAPVGSILASTKDFIAVAKKKRKLMGGGLRQAGFLAAAGIVALDSMRGELKKDHENAYFMAQRLSGLKNVSVNIEDVHINMVFFKIDLPLNPAEVVEYFLIKGIKINPPENGVYRFVTNYWVSREDVNFIVDTLSSFLSGRG
jgi:threonine aldolase